MSSPRTVSYDLTADDLAAYYRHAARRSPTPWIQAALAILFLLLTIFSATFLTAVAPEAYLAPWIFGLAFVIVSSYTVFGALARPHLDAFLVSTQEQGPFAPGAHVVSYDDHVLTWTYPGGESRVDWTAVGSTVLDANAAYIPVIQQSVVIVPRRAFDTSDGFDSFISEATHYRDWWVSR